MQTGQNGEEEAVQRAATGPAAYLEQVGSHLSEPMERAPHALHHPQSLDRLVLVLAQGTHTRARSPPRLRFGQSCSGPQERSLVAAPDGNCLEFSRPRNVSGGSWT